MYMESKCLNNNMSESYQLYVRSLEKQLELLYTISANAREKGVDPTLKTECVIAKDIADLVEGLVGPKEVAVSIRALSTRLEREEIAFKVAEEIIHGKFGHMEPEAAAEQAIRTALAYKVSWYIFRRTNKVGWRDRPSSDTCCR
jgi:DNA polymerase II large subunit